MVSQHEVPYLRPFTIATPAPGAEFTITGPGQGIWRIIGLQYTFVASAAAANRVPSLTWATGDGDISTTPSLAAVTAGLTFRYSIFQDSEGLTGAGTFRLLSAPAEGILLLPGWTLRSNTEAIDVGDQYSLIRGLVVEYPTGPTLRQTPDVYTIIEEKG